MPSYTPKVPWERIGQLQTLAVTLRKDYISAYINYKIHLVTFAHTLYSLYLFLSVFFLEYIYLLISVSYMFDKARQCIQMYPKIH